MLTEQPIKINYDYDNDTNSDFPRAFVWVAEVTHPYIPEPHCYQGKFVSYDDSAAVEIIQKIESMSPGEIEPYMKKLLG